MKYNFENIQKEVTLDFVFDGLHRRNVGILAGIGAVGKSYFVLEQVILHFLNTAGLTSKKPVVAIKADNITFLSTEDEENVITQRIQNILKNIYKEKIENIQEIEKIKQELNQHFHIFLPENQTEILQIIHQISDDTDLLILDTLSVIIELENENDNAELAKKIEKYKNIAKRKNIAILFIHHLSQAGMGVKEEQDISAEKVRGGTTLINNVRYVAILSKAKEHLFFKVVKSNYGKNTIIPMETQFWSKGFVIKEAKKGGRSDG